jgi:hypothetical protein
MPMKSINAVGWKVPFIAGGVVTAASLGGFMMTFMIGPNSPLFILTIGLFMLFFPGMYLAAAVLQQPHGPSILGKLLVGVPLNLVFYAAFWNGAARILRMSKLR